MVLAQRGEDFGRLATNQILGHFLQQRIEHRLGNVGVGAGNLPLVDIPVDRLEEAIDEIYAVNVKAYLLGARASIGPLLETGGNMVFSCSIASYRAVDDGALYVSSKHADLGIVRGLAWEFAPKVRVNGVAIGVARTSSWRASASS